MCPKSGTDPKVVTRTDPTKCALLMTNISVMIVTVTNRHAVSGHYSIVTIISKLVTLVMNIYHHNALYALTLLGPETVITIGTFSKIT